MKTSSHTILSFLVVFGRQLIPSALALGLCSCTGLLYGLGSEHRLETGERIAEVFGAPVATRAVTTAELARYPGSAVPQGTNRIEIYTRVGLVPEPGMSGAALTVSGCSFGLAEAIMLPGAIVDRASSIQRYLYVAFFSDDELLVFRPVREDEYQVVKAIRAGQ